MTKNKFDLGEVLSQSHGYDVALATRDIYLHSHYSAGGPDEEGGVEYRMATTFVKNLLTLDKNPGPVLVHLQSPGGDWGHGMAIYDAIQAVRSPVTMLGYGEISSMSGIIFQAPKRRVIMPNCELMIHRGFLTLDGVSSTVIANAAWNKKIDLKMLNVYASRAINGKYFGDRGMNHKKVLAFIDKKIAKLGDWNLDAEQAVYYGFADGVYGSPGYDNMDTIRSF